MKPATRADELRRAFDDAFAQPRTDGEELEDLLAIEIAGAPYAFRVREIASLVADRPITRVPSDRGDLIGLAGFRGAFVPVFDLAVLLGHPPAASPRWFVTTPHASIALGFAGMEGHLRVRTDAIIPYARGDAASAHVHEVVRTEKSVRSLIRMASLVESITKPRGDS